MRISGRTRAVAGIGLAVITAGAVSLTASPAVATGTTGTFHEYGTGLTASSSPYGIAAGPDGNLWVAEQYGNKVAKVTTSGVITEYPMTTASSGPIGIAAGPDGNLWCTEQSAGKVAKVTTAGSVSEYSLPANSHPVGIATGADGNLWIADSGANQQVIKMSTDGSIIATYAIGVSTNPSFIAAGADGNLWVTTALAGGVVRLTTAGGITAYSLGAGSSPFGIAAGPDGNLWVAEYGTNQVAKVNTSGSVLATYSLGTGSGPHSVATGPDGNVWITEANGNKLARLTPTGTVTEFPVPTTASQPRQLAFGPDGNPWFPEGSGNKVASLELGTTGVQDTTATVTAGVLTIALAQSSVGFGTLTPGTSSGAKPVGVVTYTNTLGDGLAWSASVAATDLVAGANHLDATNLSYTPATVSSGTGSSGTAPAAGTAGPFTFSGPGCVGDLVPGVSYTCPRSLLTAGASTQGGWVQSANTVTLSVPMTATPGVYSGSLQYSITG